MAEIIRNFFELFSSEPTLTADSGKNSNESCNPVEYNALGGKMVRTSEELALVDSFKIAVAECMKPTMEQRANLNASRKKFDVNIREWNNVAANYSLKDIKALMDAFSRLDENDDLLIDREEFLETLEHFNPTTKKSCDIDVFTIADKQGNSVIDFEEFLELCAIIDGHVEVPEKNKQVLRFENTFKTDQKTFGIFSFFFCGFQFFFYNP